MEAFKDELKKNSKKSYYSYLATSGINADAQYRDTVAESEVKTDINSTDRGSTAERLSALGLNGSGYEDYLVAENSATEAQRRLYAQRKKAISEYRNVSGYEKYLTDYEALQKKISDEVIKTLSEREDFNLDSAIKLAVGSGLSEEYAKFSAQVGVDRAKKAATKRVIYFANQKNLTPYRAKLYAESLGLDGKYASYVYDTVKALYSESYEFNKNMSAEEYIKYLKELAEAEGLIEEMTEKKLN